MRLAYCLILLLVGARLANAQKTVTYFITADRVFDGENMHTGWAVIVENDKIQAVGPATQLKAPAGAIKVYSPNSTIMPGLIEGHSHIFLYPYNITDWDTQVLKEADAYRTARATVHLETSLLAGFTTLRDLGTEGAGYGDVALKRAVNEGVIPGPRLLVAGRAIVATGSYGPKGYDTDSKIMLGAQEADGNDLARVVREQMGNGADIIKVYADYHWGPDKESLPTFSLDELKLARETANSGGRPLVAHASTKEGMRRAILAGAETIEHGDEVDDEIAGLMKSHNVTLMATLAASESVGQYKGWKKGTSPAPEGISKKKKGFKTALAEGVNIGMGGDVGVFAHGENVLEMELMAEYGMPAIDILRAATSVNARAFHIENICGLIKPGLKADLIIVSGNPAQQISDCRKVKWVMKDGVVYKDELH
ncbi:amidohydrolase family protein [Flavihumibacter fluvii]|uniref:amidohydrolase family protein n=1 Tax=Flavihumibacter fluvii TaxID=2838157 RepID=UPI001BDE38B9|nr:amidohydrolase family protein [Flavihumibacter fluvii]ULQ52048.1 amidohydrolase family protein [Flavihumibacter fluvii]